MRSRGVIRGGLTFSMGAATILAGVLWPYAYRFNHVGKSLLSYHCDGWVVDALCGKYFVMTSICPRCKRFGSSHGASCQFYNNGNLIYSADYLPLTPPVFQFGPVTVDTTSKPYQLYVGVVVDSWFPFVVFAVCSSLLWYASPRRRGKARRSRGFCVRCGYNLTGNISGMCPECGTNIDLKSAPRVAK